MRLVFVVLALAVGMVVALARPLHACSLHYYPARLGTPSGTSVPLRGSLYAEGRSPEYLTFRAVGTSVRTTLVALRPGLTRIDYDVDPAAAATELVVGFLPVAGEETQWRYPVDPGWRPAAQPARVVQYWHAHPIYDECGVQDGFSMQLDRPVAAFRILLTTDGGAIFDVLVAGASAGVSPWGDDEPELRHGGVFDLDRDTTGIDDWLDALHAGGELHVAAIELDGSVREVVGAPARLDVRAMPTPTTWSGRAMVLVPTPAVAAPPPVASPPAVDRDANLGAVLTTLLGLLGIAGVLAWRLRGRAPLDYLG